MLIQLHALVMHVLLPFADELYIFSVNVIAIDTTAHVPVSRVYIYACMWLTFKLYSLFNAYAYAYVLTIRACVHQVCVNTLTR